MLLLATILEELAGIKGTMTARKRLQKQTDRQTDRHTDKQCSTVGVLVVVSSKWQQQQQEQWQEQQCSFGMPKAQCMIAVHTIVLEYYCTGQHHCELKPPHLATIIAQWCVCFAVMHVLWCQRSVISCCIHLAISPYSSSALTGSQILNS